jgi:hypothetical protein
MDDPKRYYVEGLEKYQHFSTGLMFAVAAAAIQSAKLEGAGGLQASLEIAAWALLIVSAAIGLFNARAVPALMMAHDSVFLIQDRINRAIPNDPSLTYLETDKEGSPLRMNKDEFLKYLNTDYEKSITNFNFVQGIINRRTSVQVWAFTAGLVFLAVARGVPQFVHKGNQPIVVPSSK